MYVRFLLLLAAVAVPFVGMVAWLLSQPSAWSRSALVIVVIAAFACGIATVFGCLWRPMLAPFPPREPAPDAVRRRFQSFGLGIVNMGLSVNVAVDDECLHLMPLAIWQTLGARKASIPWSAMEPVGASRRVVRVNGHRLDGPKWCMQLAFPPEGEDEG
ncbi:MAG: hypothetical protein GY715_22105 [Planctomycetes bacterium]|nr:hypothetical protein [Planctomycetota bacterium]